MLTNYRLERLLYVKLKDGMSNSEDPDETAHWIYAVCKSLLLSHVAAKELKRFCLPVEKWVYSSRGQSLSV